ncbi:hypothetical protein NQ315_007775, partial [Exocentrus adspersus]
MLLCRLFALRPISLNNFLLDDSGNGNQQIWAVDSSVFPKNSIAKDAKSTGIKLQPIYILQPEAVRLGERGHRRYDRGRSFSPPKAVKGPLPIVATQATAGSALNNANFQAQRHPKFPDGFRKSFSSEQLYCPDRPQHHEPYSFSLSSRSSTTSTGSSTRSGIWQRDMRSGIPVAISSETKLRIRTSTASSSNVNVGPVIAR